MNVSSLLLVHVVHQHAIVTVHRLLTDDWRGLSHIDIWGRLFIKKLRSRKAAAPCISQIHRWRLVVELWHCRGERGRRRCRCGIGCWGGGHCRCASVVDHFGDRAFERGDHLPPLLSFENLNCHAGHI